MLSILIFALLFLPATISSENNATIGNADQKPMPIVGVRKMSNDEGEKFFWDYWHFGDGTSTGEEGAGLGDLASPNTSTSIPATDIDPNSEGTDIRTRSFPLQPAISPWAPKSKNRNGLDGFLSLFQRDFECPSGTHACTPINRPDRCCGAGDTCQLVQASGAADVGCCPQGVECSEEIGACPGGYATCSGALGGGCCIPGYECVVGGCAHVTIVTVTVHATVMVSTSTYTTSQNTQTAQAPTSTSSSSSSADSTGDLIPPARPTSLSTAVTSAVTAPPSSNGEICPIGFYACSAVYQGGCCRTGRDCHTTSCPEIPSTTMITDGKTIVIQVPTMTGETGHCAQGWFSCADTVGGGCCPRGFACGSSCAATGGSSTVAKAEPVSGGTRRTWNILGLGTLLLIALAINAG